MEQPTTPNVCFNCSAPKESEATKFCAYCGQKHGTGKVSLKEIFSELASNIFNLDTKTIRTATALFIPGQLTKEYFQGKHKSYSHPIRMFFVAAIFFFAAVASDLGNSIDANGGMQEFVNGFVERSSTLAIMDSLKHEIIKEYPEPNAVAAVDSMIVKFGNSYYRGVNNGEIDLMNFQYRNDSIFVDSTLVNPADFKSLSPKDFVEKYYPGRTFWRKAVIRQGIKVLKEGTTMVDYMLGKIPIMLLVMMPVLSLFLKLLYFRRNRYFVEHLFFSFHLHAFIFFSGTLIILLGDILPAGLITIFGLSIFVYLFMALKKVYEQSYGKTFVKFFAILLFYTILITVFLLLFSFISFLLF